MKKKLLFLLAFIGIVGTVFGATNNATISTTGNSFVTDLETATATSTITLNVVSDLHVEVEDIDFGNIRDSEVGGSEEVGSISIGGGLEKDEIFIRLTDTAQYSTTDVAINWDATSAGAIMGTLRGPDDNSEVTYMASVLETYGDYNDGIVTLDNHGQAEAELQIKLVNTSTDAAIGYYTGEVEVAVSTQ